MSQTTTPSCAEMMGDAQLLAVLEFHANCARTHHYPKLRNVGDLADARTAVAALIARNAELEAERDELERLCDATYVQQGADAYHHACEVLEAWQEVRFVAGKDQGCEGSLCDGLSWLQSQVTKLEDDRDALAAENKALRDGMLELADKIAIYADDDEIDSTRLGRLAHFWLGQLTALARTPAKENDDE